MGTSGSCCQTSAKCLGACEPEWVGSTGVHEQSPDILLSALRLGSGQDSGHAYSGLREEACDPYQLDGAWALAAEERWASGRMQTPVRLLSGPPVLSCVLLPVELSHGVQLLWWLGWRGPRSPHRRRGPWKGKRAQTSWGTACACVGIPKPLAGQMVPLC